LQVTIPEPRTVALLFQPVLLRCQFQVSSPGPPPIVTWKYKSFCAELSLGPAAWGDSGLYLCTVTCPVSHLSHLSCVTCPCHTCHTCPCHTCPGAELSLGPAAWGDSGLYLCTVTSTTDLQGNNEGVAELVVLGET
ncbi:LSR protein, partial [Poecile atricapillus]|nr:LSR protein [Poecile atricapillus]